MTRPLTLDQPGYYRILIQGHLTPAWAVWFGGLTMALGEGDDGQPITTMSGMITDQPELHGILMRIRDLGLPLLLVELANPPHTEGNDDSVNDSG